MTISVAIMAHRKREAFVPSILEALDAPAEVVWDTIRSRWDTGSRAMLAFDPSASHHLVVQDDAIVCRDLVAGLERAVVVSGEHPVCLYAGRVRPIQSLTIARQAWVQKTKSSWYVASGPKWGVGVVVPTSMIPEMVDWGNKHPVTPNYDLRMERWFVGRQIDCWYTAPSLVEHRHGTENPSLVKGRWATNRRAWDFIGADASALDVDWGITPSLPIDGYVRVRSTFICVACGHGSISQSQAREHHLRRHVRTPRYAKAMRGLQNA